MSGRPWTQEEINLVLKKYGKISIGRLARQVNRTAGAVYQLAAIRGKRLLLPKGWWHGELEQLVTVEAAKGSLDSDIAKAWNAAHPDKTTDRRYISELRRRLDISYDQQQVTLKLRQQAGYARQCQTLKVQSIKDLSRRARRRVVISRGWPTDCTRSECDVLDVLEPRVRMTRRQIAEALGRGDRPQRRMFANGRNGVSSLLNLCRRGWVVRSLGRPVSGHGKGRSYATYSLAQRARDWHTRATRKNFVG